MVDIRCDNCDEVFNKKPSLIERSENHYCGMECRNQSYKEDEWDFGPKTDILEMECDCCGNSFEKYPSRTERSEFDFCSKECHYEYIKEEGLRKGEKNPFWQGGYDDGYGPNWEEQRKKRLCEDEYKCLRCSITNEESKNKYGHSLNVHHIIPIRVFDGDFESANAVDNLATLCNSCHMKMEVLSPQEQESILFEVNENE